MANNCRKCCRIWGGGEGGRGDIGGRRDDTVCRSKLTDDKSDHYKVRIPISAGRKTHHSSLKGGGNQGGSSEQFFNV